MCVCVESEYIRAECLYGEGRVEREREREVAGKSDLGQVIEVTQESIAPFIDVHTHNDQHIHNTCTFILQIVQSHKHIVNTYCVCYSLRFSLRDFYNHSLKTGSEYRN